jgi:hypothetical protein
MKAMQATFVGVESFDIEDVSSYYEDAEQGENDYYFNDENEDQNSADGYDE